MLGRIAAISVLALSSLCLSPVLAEEIHDAARAGDVPRIKALLHDNPQLIDLANRKGRTPLHLAAYSGHRDVVELLLTRGVQRDLRDRHGRRPIDAAAVRGHQDIIDLLVEEEVVQLAPHIYRVTLSYGLRPNSGVSAGPDGVLIIDTGQEPVAQSLKSAVYALGKGMPKFVINTHKHHDHVEGNAVLSEKAVIIDYGNLEQRRSEGILSPGKGSLEGKEGGSFTTYDSMFFNGEEVRLIPTPGAHSDADLLVHFTGSGVVHMGDLLLTESFPAVGNHVREYLKILDTAIDVFPPGTKFIAGHGRDCTPDGLREYRRTLLDTISVVREHMKSGKNVDQMRQENVLEEWESWGEFLPFLNTDYWIEAVYDSYAVESGAVHDAARHGDVARIVALLDGHPQAVNSRNNQGRTPLHLAAYRGHEDMVELLLARGAEKGLEDRHGRRPIDAATSRGHLDIVRLLVEEEVVQLSRFVYRITLSYRSRPNTTVSAGPEGVLVIDTGEAEVADRLKSAVDGLRRGNPKYIINTHQHAPHVGGNAALDQGATIISHGNLDQRISDGILSCGRGPLVGRSGRTFDTYYSMSFNGEEIRLMPATGSHSDEDLLVYFTASRVAHMGGLLLTQSFPPVGDRIERYLEILDTAIDVLPEDTKFVGGHGQDFTLDQVKEYRRMLLDTIEVVRAHMKAGKSVAQMQQENVLNDWASWGEFIPNLNADYWIAAVHDALAVNQRMGMR